MIEDLARRVRHLVSRGAVNALDATTKLQGIAAKIAGVDIPLAEHFEPYGFTARPRGGAEAIVLHVGGDEEHPIVICVADRRYRLTTLESGEVALYDDQQQAVILARDGIVIRCNGGVGSVRVVGEVSASLGATDGVVHGSGIDPYTGQTYASLGVTSSVLLCQKEAGS